MVEVGTGVGCGEGEGAGSMGTACLPLDGARDGTTRGTGAGSARGAREGPPKEVIHDEAQEQLSLAILQGLVFHHNASILIAKQ